MKLLDRILAWAGFGCVGVAVLIGPWLFGAWEMWWFWPFAVSIFLATFFFACRLVLDPGALESNAGAPIGHRPSAIVMLLFYVLFLAYALVRFFQAGVFMDAERSFLLFLTPLLVGAQVVFGFGLRQRRLLFVLLFVDLFVLGVYGVVNHLVTGSAYVLWADGFPQYVNDHRASGTYFCPDHFAGIMELAFGMALALLLGRRVTRGWRVWSVVLAMLAVAGVLLSKSRGGGLTIVVMVLAGLCWGLSGWPRGMRWYLRGAVLMTMLAGLLVLWSTDLAYVHRFRKYFAIGETDGASFTQRQELLTRKMIATSRGRMIGGALRAWKLNPVFGIGPGMHQNLWPHVAASEDGDREKGIWPSRPNYDFHSYEVHSDWVQLLEEYGMVGMVLFLLAAGILFAALVARRPREDGLGWCDDAPAPLSAAPLAALFAFVAMAFHSLGDFNLQMPATTWVLAALLALPLGECRIYKRNE